MLHLILRRLGLASEDDDHRIITLDLRQPAQATGVVGQLEVGNVTPGPMSARIVMPPPR
jgi:hypothetical protein